MPLTYKQRMFVAYYIGVSNGNATDAARRAGYAWPEKVAERLVGKSGIRAAIEAKVTSVAMSQDEVLARVSEIAAATLFDFLSLERGAKKLVTTASLKRAKRQGKGHLLKRLKTKDGDIDIELESKYAALKLLGEYHGLWDRERPPEISLVELAKRLKEQHDRNRGMGNPDKPAGGLPE